MLSRFLNIQRCLLIKQPTPFNQMEMLSGRFSRQLWVKRDDLNGVAAGGNKVRKLEYLLQDAIASNAKAVITGGALQSNHASATALCAQRFGLKTYLALSQSVPIQGEHYENGANLVLDNLAQAAVQRFPAGSSTNENIALYAAQIENEMGFKPYEIVMGGSSALGALGYVRAALELADQASSISIQPTSLVHASGSAGTQAGLIVGMVLAGLDTKVVGISVLNLKETLFHAVLQLCEQTADMLQLPAINWHEKIWISDAFIGDGYGLPNEGTLAAIRTGMREEGILFDPCYTGKAFQAFLALNENDDQGLLGDTSVFLHTGGISGMFGYQQYF
ncbi:D-cysteine desulfhydrase family protein [Alteromonas sediminis]|uniref:D-cysteine desulfhydrase family protein n=1 Tax=Alteromonas sediminis TaxID=2259342 RepID=A0A3N5Z9I7_9ALTE|nr:D-cysteine desulfhydrase family protein [Alteromonas sediminis]RPJ65928.1 D-cysteine desulfhydrase family protein [Alteromonas sediminis]